MKPERRERECSTPDVHHRADARQSRDGGGGSSASASVSAGCDVGATAIACITVDSNGAVCNSGGSMGAIAAAVSREYTRTHTPGRTRPARPFRCAALAALHHPSRNAENLVAGSCVNRFARPVSTTYVTSGIVNDVSATFVASTIFRAPAGGGANARCCSFGVS